MGAAPPTSRAKLLKSFSAGCSKRSDTPVNTPKHAYLDMSAFGQERTFAYCTFWQVNDCTGKQLDLWDL